MQLNEVIYIGSLPKIQMQFLVPKNGGGDMPVMKTFARWQPTATAPVFRTMLDKKDDFIVGQYPLRKQWDRTDGKMSHVLLRRYGALGDIVVLIPAVRQFKRVMPLSFSLMCGPSYTQLFAHDDTFEKVYTMGSEHAPADISLNLDGILERDLAWIPEFGGPDPRFLVPRVNAYYNFFAEGFDVSGKFTPDYSLKTSQQDKLWAAHIVERTRRIGGNRKVVALQARGSGAVRSVGRKRMIEISKRLAKEYNVLVIDGEQQATWNDESLGIFPVYGRPLLNIVELLRLCDAAVVTDSGLQWLAHVAATPMVSILGPTRWTEKVVTHPLYNERRVAWVDTAKLSKCPVCFENAIQCKWKYSCLTGLDLNVLWREISRGVRKVIGNDN